MGYYCGDDFSQGQNLASEIRFLLRGFNVLKLTFSDVTGPKQPKRKIVVFIGSLK